MILLLKELMPPRRGFLRLMMCLVAFFSSGCNKKKEDALVEVLGKAGGGAIASIERIDLTTTNGLPAAKKVLEAEVIKRFTKKLEIQTFEKVVIEAHEPGNYNHPVASDDLILRVKTTHGTWTMLCGIFTLDDYKTCMVEAGAAGQTNFNILTTPIVL